MGIAKRRISPVTLRREPCYVDAEPAESSQSESEDCASEATDAFLLPGQRDIRSFFRVASRLEHHHDIEEFEHEEDAARSMGLSLSLDGSDDEAEYADLQRSEFQEIECVEEAWALAIDDAEEEALKDMGVNLSLDDSEDEEWNLQNPELQELDDMEDAWWSAQEDVEAQVALSMGLSLSLDASDNEAAMPVECSHPSAAGDEAYIPSPSTPKRSSASKRDFVAEAHADGNTPPQAEKRRRVVEESPMDAAVFEKIGDLKAGQRQQLPVVEMPPREVQQC